MNMVSINEIYKEKDQIYILTSDDIPGLFLAGPDRDLLYKDLNNVINKINDLDYNQE